MMIFKFTVLDLSRFVYTCVDAINFLTEVCEKIDLEKGVITGRMKM